MSLRAGFAVADITPPLGLPMGGYAARAGVASGVLDPLQCRAAVFSTPEETVAVAVLDLLWVSGPWAESLRARVAAALGAVRECVVIAATHTHSGPAVFSGDATLSAYETVLAENVIATARAAHAALEPVVLHAGAGVARGVGASRRDPAEQIDERARVLSARRRDGTCAGVLASFGCHPTVLSPANLDYSRDLFGAAADAASERIGGPVLLFNGAAADVSTRFTRREATAGEMRRLGAIVGEAIAVTERRSQEPEATSQNAALSGRCRRVPLRLRRLPAVAEGEARLAAAAAGLEAEREHGAGPARLRLATSRLEGALAQLHFAREGGWRSLFGRVPDACDVQAVRIGGFRLLAAPGEIFSAVGARLCAGGDTMLAGYANDYLGYLVPPERAGEGEYEALMAAVEPVSAAAIENALAGMRDDV